MPLTAQTVSATDGCHMEVYHTSILLYPLVVLTIIGPLCTAWVASWSDIGNMKVSEASNCGSVPDTPEGSGGKETANKIMDQIHGPQVHCFLTLLQLYPIAEIAPMMNFDRLQAIS
ncbi:uncharacterized protein HD556DRAFT_1304764 [Suillus plorans]|uniref:Uncharacterized protein n=1 Tax=Suillus plorans TaxID=116603 RepID=A0A9P7DQM1_9AGAM|nr:uncharacterized protein HD556DRAFT_1304764 [Suillus plorans]KAG1800748.1 hypothetical protein HD556DRAFT_1304764 [Suillus plorans]